MLRAGMSLTAVMKLLGHTSPEMTMQYLHVTLNDLQRAFELARSKPRHLFRNRGCRLLHFEKASME
jgi:site-specific recombinase XerD